jgi:citrate lyase subunit beta/citryl-CoA lyase
MLMSACRKFAADEEYDLISGTTISNKLRTLVPYLPLFVPATRPDRFARAAASGATAVIIDLEDAVAADAKSPARDQLRDAAIRPLASTADVFIRVNALGTRWHDDDVTAAAALPICGVMLPKCQSPDQVHALKQRLPGAALVIALIETPLGMANARAIAAAAERIAFGSIDYAGSINAQHTHRALAAARAELVLAAALAGRAGPIDGVTVKTSDARAVRLDSRLGASLGMGGKLLIHPHQVGPARQAYRPSDADIARAQRTLEVADGGAAALDGMMIDAPVIEWARRILAAAAADPER